MIKALLLIFEPVQAWERIVRAQRGLVFVLFVYLTPVVVLTPPRKATAGALGPGAERRELSEKISPGEAIVYEVGPRPAHFWDCVPRRQDHQVAR